MNWVGGRKIVGRVKGMLEIMSFGFKLGLDIAPIMIAFFLLYVRFFLSYFVRL